MPVRKAIVLRIVYPLLRYSITLEGREGVRELTANEPITGIAGCARAASGHDIAPPSAVMNSGRLM
jgi:hypothetical protein